MTKPKSHRKVFIISGLVVLAMFAFSFALVPLYSVICRATGINTAVRSDELFKPAGEGLNNSVDLSREVTVQFVSVNHNGLPWDFYPHVKSMRVHPGERNKVAYFAKNTANKTMTIQAVPSMTPPESARHFHKIECFCFNQQTLKAGESKDMALIFQIDKDLPKEVRTITLAYTLFEIVPPAKGNDQ
jgi:cytochrome c oxidase assembly protein subunit 11